MSCWAIRYEVYSGFQIKPSLGPDRDLDRAQKMRNLVSSDGLVIVHPNPRLQTYGLQLGPVGAHWGLLVALWFGVSRREVPYQPYEREP